MRHGPKFRVFLLAGVDDTTDPDIDPRTKVCLNCLNLCHFCLVPSFESHKITEGRCLHVFAKQTRRKAHLADPAASLCSMLLLQALAVSRS